jgi:hypothetical protein
MFIVPDRGLALRHSRMALSIGLVAFDCSTSTGRRSVAQHPVAPEAWSSLAIAPLAACEAAFGVSQYPETLESPSSPRLLARC